MDSGGKKIEVSCGAYQFSVGAGCVSASVWSDELGRVLQPDVLGDKFDQVVEYYRLGSAIDDGANPNYYGSAASGLKQ
jgi:hypothetical protein